MFHSVTVLGHVFDLSGFAKVTSPLVLPFAHEDLAIALGGYIVVNKLMPSSLVALSLYGGMIASDFALCGLGAAARHLPWLGRYAIDERVKRFADVLGRNIFGVVALCRVVPGVVFVAFVACGWARVSLARFTAASLIVSALYLPPMLYLVIAFGDALDDRLGTWAWPMLFVVLAAAGFARKRMFAFADAAQPDAGEATLPRSSFGMPPLSRSDCKAAAAERIGALYRDGRRFITAALEERFDAIARSMREFHYGRFDLRFASVEALMRGEELAIVEINGIGGEAIDCWDPRLSVGEVYRRLAAQQRLLFAIGARNRARGFRPSGSGAFLASLIRQTRLIGRYPARTEGAAAVDVRPRTA